MDEPDFQPLISTPQFSDVLQNWVLDGRSEWIEHVMVAGQWKVKNRKGCVLNEAELVVRQRQLMKKTDIGNLEVSMVFMLIFFVY